VAASSLIKLAGLRDVPEGGSQTGKVLNQSMASLCASEFSQIWLRNLACWFAFFDECWREGANAIGADELMQPQARRNPYSREPVTAIEPFPLICSAC